MIAIKSKKYFYFLAPNKRGHDIPDINSDEIYAKRLMEKNDVFFGY